MFFITCGKDIVVAATPKMKIRQQSASASTVTGSCLEMDVNITESEARNILTDLARSCGENVYRLRTVNTLDNSNKTIAQCDFIWNDAERAAAYDLL